MSLFDLLFGGGQSIQIIFRNGFIPTENDFLELTEEQYERLRATGETGSGRFFMIAPQDPHICIDPEANEVFIVSESEKELFLQGARLIDRYCEGQTFQTDKEKLRYMASQLPDVFSNGTKYEKYQNLSVVKQ